MDNSKDVSNFITDVLAQYKLLLENQTEIEEKRGDDFKVDVIGGNVDSIEIEVLRPNYPIFNGVVTFDEDSDLPVVVTLDVAKNRKEVGRGNTLKNAVRTALTLSLNYRDIPDEETSEENE